MAKTFTPREFQIPALKGLSAQTIEEHLKLYQGYVKNANQILEKLPEYRASAEQDPSVAYYTSEMQRRFPFEFCGMRNHEIYFGHFEGGPAALANNSPLSRAIKEEFGSIEEWLASFKAMALTRGVGWAMLCMDPGSGRLLNNWNDEQHLGHLVGTTPLLALDMWEHSFVADYQPSGKKQYVEDFFGNLNWSSVEENLSHAK